MKIRRLEDIPTKRHDISKYMPALREIAAQRDRQKKGYASTLNLSDESPHLLGGIGEITLTLETGIPPNLALLISGDPGFDITENDVTYDAKAVTHQSPDLKEMLNRDKSANRYILIHTDCVTAKVIGWAAREQIENAPLANYGYGNRRSIPWYDLRDMGQLGLPPELPIDHDKGFAEAQKALEAIAICA
jgi:hypothetical protein